MTDAEKNKRDAFLMLDAISEYSMDAEYMQRELSFNYGYSEREAKAIYNEWARQA